MQLFLSVHNKYCLSSSRRPTFLYGSVHFDIGWSGCNTMPTEFNVQIDASAHFDARHATHNLLIDAQASNRGNMVQMVFLNDLLEACR